MKLPKELVASKLAFVTQIRAYYNSILLKGIVQNSYIKQLEREKNSSKLWSSQLWTQFKQLRYRCDALTNRAKNTLTLGAGYLSSNEPVKQLLKLRS